MSKILVLHGPNLNLLGQRQNSIYGDITLEEINRLLSHHSSYPIDYFQSNAEHELINRIQLAKEERVSFLIVNLAALTHTSIALRDTLLAVDIPFVEVHLSNIYARESFRHHSYFSDIAIGVIAGLGIDSYLLALQFAEKFLKKKA